MATRLLIIGFSCTESSVGYAPLLIEKIEAQEPDCTVCWIGLGALQPSIIPAMIRRAHGHFGPFTHVVLEVGTSAFAIAQSNTDAIAEEVLRDMLDSVREMNALPFFLLLFRDFTRTIHVDFNAKIIEMCEQQQIGYLDLADGLVASRGIDFARSILVDDVHTNDEGARFQADAAFEPVLSLVRTPPASKNFGKIVDPPRYFRRPVPVADLLGTAPYANFRRRSLELGYVRILRGEELVIDLGEPRRVLGLSFLYGPWRAQCEVYLDDAEKPIPLIAFDALSYFHRLGLLVFPGREEGTLVQRIRLSKVRAVEGVELRKGKVKRPIQMLLVDLVTMERTEDLKD